MAMHIPRAPGFSQMIKDGAKVIIYEYSNNITLRRWGLKQSNCNYCCTYT